MEPLFKYQSRFYNVQRNYYFKHRGMKLQWNNKLFPSINAIHGKSSLYGIKGFIRH